jgi:hypothetical protein
MSSNQRTNTTRYQIGSAASLSYLQNQLNMFLNSCDPKERTCALKLETIRRSNTLSVWMSDLCPDGLWWVRFQKKKKRYDA